MLEIRAASTEADVDNAPMRAVNRAPGYQPRPDEIGFRGPLWPARAGDREGSN